MTKTMIIFRNSLVRSRLLIILSIVFGLVLCFFFNVTLNAFSDTNTSGVPVGILDRDNSRVSDAFIEYITDDIRMEAVKETDIDVLNSHLVEKNIAAIIEIPSEFEKDIVSGEADPINVTYTDDYENAAFINEYIDGYIQSLEILTLASGEDMEKFHELLDKQNDDRISVESIPLDEEIMKKIGEKNGLALVFGFFLLIAFLIAMGFSSLIFRDRTDGTFDRVRITNVNTVQYLIGMCLSSIICSMLLISGFFIFIKINGTYLEFSITPLFILCLSYSIMIVGLALMIAMWLNSSNAITSAITGIATIGCILGGAFFPIKYSPEYLQQLARITPQFWFMEGMSNVTEGNSGGWIFNTVILTLFALLFFIMAGVRFAGNRTKAV